MTDDAPRRIIVGQAYYTKYAVCAPIVEQQRAAWWKRDGGRAGICLVGCLVSPRFFNVCPGGPGRERARFTKLFHILSSARTLAGDLDLRRAIGPGSALAEDLSARSSRRRAPVGEPSDRSFSWNKPELNYTERKDLVVKTKIFKYKYLNF